MSFLTGAFLVTGIVVGFFSPGKTMIEPAIARQGLPAGRFCATSRYAGVP